jgi:RNA polymerase sigma factor (sigma-70 family)
MTNSVSQGWISMSEPQATRRTEAAWEPTRDEMLDALFRQQYAGLLRLAAVMVGSREAAEDAVQDAFASLHRNWRSLRGTGDPLAYLRSAVLNRCRSWVRRQVTLRAVRPLMLVRSHHPSPEDAVVDRDEVGSVVAVMRTLPRRQCEVLACRFVLQLSIAETAQQLAISEGSVKAHTHRGLKALHERIEVSR